jgi:hypothetical protein
MIRIRGKIESVNTIVISGAIATAEARKLDCHSTPRLPITKKPGHEQEVEAVRAAAADMEDGRMREGEAKVREERLTFTEWAGLFSGSSFFILFWG